jgi:Alpha/beta hydrolase domain
MLRRVLCGAASAALLSISLTGAANAATGSASGSAVVSGPVTGGNGVPVLFGHTSFDLASVGYRQSEFFLSGTATAFAPVTPLTSDGAWTVAPSAQAPFTTRLVVNRPANPRAFNGTVVVEWLNVSGGVDASPDWIHMHDELIRGGYAWVGVSAQAVGLNALKVPPQGDPARYASLSHPGDSFSYDMFSQAGKAVRDNAATVLSGLRPRHVIAVGESQSAGRMVTYIDAVQPLAKVYDGFLVHSRSGSGAPLSQPPQATVLPPTPTLIRTDLRSPVLVFTTETDAGSLLARQPDNPRFRLWEVAGTSHFDLYGLAQGAVDTGREQSVADWFATMQRPPAQPSPDMTCNLPVNTGPATFVLRSEIASRNRWVAGGVPPAHAARFETVSLSPPQYALDGSGNVRGGIRTPAVDAAVARISGFGNSGAQFCILFGSTSPLTADQLTALYGDHRGFVAAWTRATLHAFAAGFLRPEDTANLLIAGARSDVLR